MAGTAQAGDANTVTPPKAAAKHHVVAKKIAVRRRTPIAPAYAGTYQAQAPYAPPVDLAAPLVPIARAMDSIGLPAKDGTLTYHGVTVYGGIDLGLGYQSHGAPLSSVYGPGRNYTPNAANAHTQVGFMPNALSYSNFGVKGVEEIVPGLSFVFNLQTTFVPTSAQLSNGNKAQVLNNGVALPLRTSGGDSSRNGQIDNAQAYGGFVSPTFGTITFGRQNALTLDAVIAYDPMSASNAFSLIGFAGMTPGGGNTEDARQGDSLKYRVNFGPFRAAGMYKFDEFGNTNRNAYAAQLGGEYQGFSADVIYSVVKDSVTTASLGVGAVTPTNFNELAGTVSDNYAVMAVASYKIDKFKFFAGYENIRFENPENPLAAGSPAEGYQLFSTANANFTKNRIVDIFWGGVKYAFRDNIDLIGAYYHYTQNSYATGATAGCSSRFVAANCSGTQDAGSVLIDYRFSKRFDVYAGAMYGIVHGGFANGYAPTATNPTGTATNTIDPTVGFRFQF
ncbi:porin [Beijerinckia sp. L45]|uniref:porin n=1 Tax=Beijerinckia sp. L45 TaxID=1641855 RepID=UPI00131E72F0|nr:porin [Beijerinckia sp. L45]